MLTEEGCLLSASLYRIWTDFCYKCKCGFYLNKYRSWEGRKEHGFKSFHDNLCTCWKKYLSNYPSCECAVMFLSLRECRSSAVGFLHVESCLDSSCRDNLHGKAYSSTISKICATNRIWKDFNVQIFFCSALVLLQACWWIE